MRYVYILEDEERFQRQLHQTLLQIDPKLNVRFFTDLAELSKFVQNLIQDGKIVVSKFGKSLLENVQVHSNEEEDSQLALLICKEELVGISRLSLLEKTQELIIRKGLSLTEDPMPVLMTAFDKEGFNLQKFSHKFIQNVLMKPFDPLILQQHLHIALNGRKNLKTSTVHQMKTQYQVEMIKDVQAEVFSDIGFITRSPRELSVGHLSKYYGPFFQTQKRNYVFARCVRCEKHPELIGEFRCWFTFVAQESIPHMDYRRNLLQNKLPEIIMPKALKPNEIKEFKIVLIESQENKRKDFKTAIQQYHPQSKISDFLNWDDFIVTVDPLTYDSEQKILAWKKEEPLQLILSIENYRIIQMNMTFTEGEGFLGLGKNEVHKKEFSSFLSENSKNIWDGIVNSNGFSSTENKGSKVTIQLRSPHGVFVVNVLEYGKNPNGEGLQLILEKATLEERTAWYKKNIVDHSPIHLILCPYELVKNHEDERWKRIHQYAEKNWNHKIQIMAFGETMPSEKEVRSLPSWVLDVFSSGQDKRHFLRKIAFHFGDHFDEDFKFYQKEQEIRVANPIELSQISEAALSFKYYRTISPGSFRKFVLPSSTGSEPLEYMASCIFSESDPANKESFISHFVFFAITDVYLKNIRVWIRENYAHEKNKAS